MVYRERTGGTISITEDNAVVEGVYRGFITRASKLDATKTQYIHSFEQPDGSTQSVYGFGQMDSILKTIAIGAKVRVTYLGKEKVEGYASKLHQCKVEVDDEHDEETPF